MNIEIERRGQNNSTEDTVNFIAKEFGLSNVVANLIANKGITTYEEVDYFLHPNKYDYADPYLLTGMKEVVERIKQAVKNKETILVYGDYDADGICGTYILKKAILLLDPNADVHHFIPNRSEGYGLSFDTLELVAETYHPDLLITCDLGISCKDVIKEAIEYAGIDVLVSDHHELPEEIPDCPCVNPKLDANTYPCPDLCGAGVALKIAQALLPGKENEFIEFAAIATVADSVPLIKENRKIVVEGLKKMNKNPSTPIKALIDGSNLKGKITSTSIAFVLAPRINASGRMGVAVRSLDMFLANSYEKSLEFVNEISQDNAIRQKKCDEIYNTAKELFLKEQNSYAVLIEKDDWHSGLLGIVSSRLADEFQRPTILFALQGDCLRGSGRSIEGVNLFEMLSTMTDLFQSFGGHAQACGLTIKKSDFPEFKQRVNNYLKEKNKLVFLPKYNFDIDADLVDVDLSLLKQIELLEPFGVGNPKPVFKKTENSMLMSLSSNPKHVIGDDDYKYLTAFNMGKYLHILRSNVQKCLLLDYQIDSYKGVEKIKANVKDFITLENLEDNQSAIKNYLFNMDGEYYRPIDKAKYLEILDQNPFATLTVVNTKEGLNKVKELLKDRDVIFEYGAIRVKGNLNRVIYSPNSPLDFERFNNVIFFERFSPFKYEEMPQSATYYTLDDISLFKDNQLVNERELFAKCYQALKSLENCRVLSYNNITFKLSSYGVLDKQLLFAFAVFKELGLIKIENDVLRFDKSKKVNLTDSLIFRSVN